MSAKDAAAASPTDESSDAERDFAEKVAQALELEDGTPAMTDELRSLPGWDSLAELSLVATLDADYDVQIEKPDLDQLVTLRDLFAEVMRRKETADRASSPRRGE